jgi:putative aldouronate transport system permease protein
MFFLQVFKNTLRISIVKIIFGFPAPIIFALLLNEIGGKRFKKVSQTISYLPHFLSWVIVSGFVYQLLSPEVGVVNYVLGKFGYEPIFFMTKKNLFIPILVFFDLWKGVGWDSIIYLAAISNVDPALYESAEIDGANRFKRAIHITIPSIIPTITILFILALGGIVRAGFDDIFNLYNPMVMDVADVLETCTFRIGLYEARYDYAAAVGLFQNIIAIILIMTTNLIVKKYNDYALW